MLENQNIVVRHRIDIGMNTEFKLKLTSRDEKAFYSRNLPARMQLKEDLIIELALMHNFGIITVLHFPKKARPSFAQKVHWKTAFPCGSHGN